MVLNEHQPLLSSSNEQGSINQHGSVLETYYDESLGIFYTINSTGMPTWRAAISAMATVAGIGVLGLAHGVGGAGWVGIPLLIFLGFMASYTAKILLKSMYLQRETVTETYHGLSKVAFGPKGYYTVVAMQNLALFSAGILFIILSGISMQQLKNNWGIQVDDHGRIWAYVLITFVVVLPAILGLKTLKEVSWIAIFGIGATCFAIVIIVIMPILYHFKMDLPKVDHDVISSGQTFTTAFSAMVFAYGGHNVFPALASDLKDTRSYRMFMDVAYICIVGLYLLPAIIPYIFFGSDVSSPVLITLSKYAAEGGKAYSIPIDMAWIAMLLHLWMTIPIINNPVFLWIEEITELSKRKHQVPIRIGYRFLLLSSQVAIAMVLPYFDPIMNIIGSTMISGTVFFLPCFIYLKLNWRNIKSYEIGWIYIVLLLATVGSVVGLINSIVDLRNAMVTDHLVLSDKVFFSILGSSTALAAAGLVLIFIIIRRKYTFASV